jgi:deoxyribose-phosphate aldolase
MVWQRCHVGKMSQVARQISSEQLAGRIEHSLLAAAVSREQIIKHCSEALKYGFASACINPRWVDLAAEKLRGSAVKVCSVVGFPLGADSTKIKVAQAREVIFAGADEIDMAADLAAVIEADVRYLVDQLHTVLRLCRSMRPAVVLKVIIESAALDKQQKIFACQVCQQVGVDFIKTSTGFHPAGGATVEDVELIRQIAPNCRIKAAGGIRTAQQVVAMLTAGAERVGSSCSVQIMEQFKACQS